MRFVSCSANDPLILMPAELTSVHAAGAPWAATTQRPSGREIRRDGECVEPARRLLEWLRAASASVSSYPSS